MQLKFKSFRAIWKTTHYRKPVELEVTVVGESRDGTCWAVREDRHSVHTRYYTHKSNVERIGNVK